MRLPTWQELKTYRRESVSSRRGERIGSPIESIGKVALAGLGDSRSVAQLGAADVGDDVAAATIAGRVELVDGAVAIDSNLNPRLVPCGGLAEENESRFPCTPFSVGTLKGRPRDRTSWIHDHNSSLNDWWVSYVVVACAAD